MSKKENAISVIVCNVGEEPKVSVIKNTLEAMQEIVGGYIETVAVGHRDYVFVMNEEGYLLGLKPNRKKIVGNFFVCRSAPPNFASVREEDKEILLKWLNRG